ncbi:methyl-accepting chemotaxis protein [Aestuariicella sp. G3-2]|uniref:methyl-accepting chemotaxis protein n=1 Tax=Pseudomaricurvus albidus TaxID=2842452 RepID=UPI001C0E085A|nr:methyl-accepting chemotaxis protein [Aestuariicella albida]MBU3069589.1 methyl-accepting chemotaxis protein [Aestuariicella albida]
MALLRKFKIQLRLWILIGIVMAGLLALIGTGLSQLHNSLLTQKSQNTKLLVELAYNTLGYYQNKEASGELTRAQAQAEAKAALKHLRYDGDNYFWIQDAYPRMIMHPTKPQLDGSDLSGNTDPQGKHLFVEMAKIAKAKGEGQVDYMWPLPGQDTPVDKISYVKNFQAWGWIVGSGVYIVDVQAAFNQAAISPFVIGVIIIFVIGILAWLIGRSITAPLSATSAALYNIAAGEGDLTQRLDDSKEYNDEIAFMTKSFNAFVSKIERTMIQVRGATEKLTNASAQLRLVLENNSASMEKQQQESQAVVAAITEMACTANEIAKNSEGAASSASDANHEAESGRNVVTEAVSSVNTLAMEVKQASTVIDSLNADSLAISSVLDVIRGIAEQTNLLALNAAIEAARAGEQGRGFAVVADEVRTLAARTQSSTEEIRVMIESLQNGSAEAVKAMQRGGNTTEVTVTKAEEAGNSLSNIVSAINTITDMNMQIASAAEEQSVAAQEIDRGINLMADLTAQSYSEIEKTSESSRELEELSTSLSRLVGEFKISA